MKINMNSFVKAKVNINITPGEMLKTLRELQGLSQKDLSELTGISQSNISALETNIRKIGRDRALTLAKALKVHPAVILFPDYQLEEVA
jgi:transcriptional regulator with XRE-family HTH domain